jgi:hypothetical protein
LRAWTTTSRLPRIAGHGRGVGAQAPPRRSPAPAHTVFLHLPGTTGGRDGHSRTDGRTPTWTPARTAVQDGHLAWPAGRRERTPRRTATATDRMPDAFLWSSAVVHPCGLAWEYEMTNDSVPHTVGCGGDRPLGVRPCAVRPGTRAVSSRPGRERPSRPPVWLGGRRPSRASLLGQPFPTGSRCGPAREQGKQHEPTTVWTTPQRHRLAPGDLATAGPW